LSRRRLRVTSPVVHVVRSPAIEMAAWTSMPPMNPMVTMFIEIVRRRSDPPMAR
jgi:hypothetical protein